MGYTVQEFDHYELSVALTGDTDANLAEHLDRESGQEDLTFAFWWPSVGAQRYTAIVDTLLLPQEGERILQGNAAFTSDYLRRALGSAPPGAGLVFIHNHLGPGWQGMSHDDVVAEQDRLAAAVAARTSLPLVGMTKGTDGSWSARLWLRAGRNLYERRWVPTVRSVGRRLKTTFHPELKPPPGARETQQATVSVWGPAAQADLARTHVGIVGVGSVGSIVAEALSRMGVQRMTFIDHDVVEERNLDRTLGASVADALLNVPKVLVAGRAVQNSHTSEALDLKPVPLSLLTPEGLGAALDCDVLISCVDRPWPRFLLNVIAYGHLIPVIDGGILARVDEDGLPLHIDWRIHTVGPDRRCLHCLGALLRSDVALDMEGKLDDPDYLRGLSAADRARFGRRNVFPFSLSVAAHEVLQLVGLATGMSRVGGVGPQRYHCYPGEMTVEPTGSCDADCDIAPLTATAPDLAADLQAAESPPEQPCSR